MQCIDYHDLGNDRVFKAIEPINDIYAVLSMTNMRNHKPEIWKQRPWAVPTYI